MKRILVWGLILASIGAGASEDVLPEIATESVLRSKKPGGRAHEHECVHDKVAAPPSERVFLDLGTGLETEPTAPGDAWRRDRRERRFRAAAASKDDATSDDRTVAPPLPERGRSATRTTGTARPVRVHIETSDTLNDPLRLCRDGASRYFDGRGDPGSTTLACVTTSSTDCWRTCLEGDELTDAKYEFLTTRILPQIASHFEASLSTLGLADGVPLRASVSTCGGTPVPDRYATDGVDGADVALLLTLRPTQGSTIAYAAACAFDADTGRPVLGYVNWGSNSIATECDATDKLCTEESNIASQVAVGIHEASHAMGVSSSLFDSYYDWDTGLPHPGGVAVPRTLTSTDGEAALAHEVLELVTPTVVEAARIHFACDTLTGIEIENQGSSGTAGSHWEKRMLWNEYMTGTASRNSVLSNLTLALFHDSGWYRANFSNAQPLAWGFRRGCSFIQQRCSSWTAEAGHPGYFCGSPSAVGCTHDRNAIAGCQISQVPPAEVEPWYRYASLDGGATTIIGNDALADYCPIFVPFTNGVCTDAANYKAEVHDPLASQFATDALCFQSTVQDATASDGPLEEPAPACYRHACEGPGKARVKVGRIWYPCPEDSAGTIGGFSGHHGEISCPPSWELCPPGTRRILWPDVLEVSPSTITAIGGAKLTVFGKFFSLFGTNVFLDGELCQEIDVESPAVLTCRSPALTEPPAAASAEGGDVPSRSVGVLVIDARGRSTYTETLLQVRASASSRSAVPHPFSSIASLAVLFFFSSIMI